MLNCLHAQISDIKHYLWFIPWQYNAKVEEKVPKCAWKINSAEYRLHQLFFTFFRQFFTTVEALIVTTTQATRSSYNFFLL